MRFLPVFTLRVTHSYYTDGRCPDFSMRPSLATEGLLKNHRCVLKALPDGIRILMQVNDDGKPFIAYPKGAVFTFCLRLHNPDFSLFTNLSDLANQLAPLYTNAGANAGGETTLRLVSRSAWSTESFAVEHSAPDQRFVLSGRPLAGVTLDEFEVGHTENVSLRTYDGTTRTITVNTQSARTGETFTVTYPVAPRLGKGVFAEVALHNNDALQPTEGGSASFHIAFQARQARWKYYVVTDLESNGKEFHIKHPTLRFSDTNRTNLTEHPDASDDLATELADRYPKLQIFRFVSDGLISCHQKAWTNLELHFDQDRLFEAMPNPSWRTYCGKRSEEGAFSQIVKYVSKPFP